MQECGDAHRCDVACAHSVVPRIQALLYSETQILKPTLTHAKQTSKSAGSAACSFALGTGSCSAGRFGVRVEVRVKAVRAFPPERVRFDSCRPCPSQSRFDNVSSPQSCVCVCSSLVIVSSRLGSRQSYSRTVSRSDLFLLTSNRPSRHGPALNRQSPEQAPIPHHLHKVAERGGKITKKK